MQAKYLKPRSLTWWASAAPLGAGVFLALEPVHELVAWVAVVRSIVGDVPPAVLINVGLGGIGLRGALGP